MAMTSKDYVAIARAVQNNCDYPENPTDVRPNLIEELANYMATNNPNFCRARFIRACYGKP